MKRLAAILGLFFIGATAQDSIILGDEFMRLQNWPVAVTYFEQALKEDPSLGHGWYGKGLSLCQMGKHDQGIKALEEAIRLEPKNYGYLYVAGVCHEWKGRENWSQAEAYYLKALQLAPKEVQLHHKLGTLLQQEGRCQEAIPEFKKALELNPGYFISYNNLGNCWLSLNRPEQAVKLYQQAIAHSEYPGAYHFYNHLGIALLSAARIEEAKAAFLIETAQNPDFVDPHLNLGNIYLLGRNYERAIEEYQDVLAIDPDRPEGHLNLGQLYLLIGQAQLAGKHFEKYVELKPDSGKGHYFLGQCYSKLGDQARAWDEMNKSLQLGYHPEPLKEQIKRESR